ncbi:hypothetical protein HY632_03055 [Candidatus Uhrbacteria bacterium]|nr:hypothetical protein [Candidatus Uhrbacteria bacterium]
MELCTRRTTRERWVRRVTRGACGALLLFELVGLFGALRYPIAFTWFGLFATLVVVWSFLELSAWYLDCVHQRPYPISIWPLVLLGVGIDAWGDIFRWYMRWPWYDQVAHFTGSALVMGILGTLVHRAQWYARLSWRVQWVSLVALGSVVGVLYEIEEYLEDWMFHTNRLGDGPDTANDLLMNLLGASVVAAVLVVRWRAHRHVADRLSRSSPVTA